MNTLTESKRQKMEGLAIYLRGASEALNETNEPFSCKLTEASAFLEEAAMHTCSQGYIGCRGGDKCTSDHK